MKDIFLFNIGAAVSRWPFAQAQLIQCRTQRPGLRPGAVGCRLARGNTEEVTPRLAPLGTMNRTHLIPFAFALRSMFCIGLFPLAMKAQELYLTPGTEAGAMSAPGLHESSFSFEYGYRQYITPNFAASMTWLNEGHVIDHHRDGVAWEIWGNKSFLNDKLAFSVGAGPYYYFDTQSNSGVAGDVHGTAPIYSLTATYYAGFNTFVRLSAHYVDPSRDIQIETVDLDIGFWLDRSPRPQSEAKPMWNTWSRADLKDSGTGEDGLNDQLSLFGGGSVENSYTGEHRLAWAAEYRRTFLNHLDATVTYIDETNLKIARRRGIALQAWPTYRIPWELNGRSVWVGAGVGAYSAIGSRNQFKQGQYLTPIVAPFFSQTIAIGLNKSNSADFRITWNRVTGYNSVDADVVLFGLGYRWR